MKSQGKEMTKRLIKAICIIGVFSVGFASLTEFIRAEEVSKVKTSATSYDFVALTSGLDVEIPEGYVKADYKVEERIIPGQEIDKKDLSAEQAAELGARALWKTYKVSLEQATVRMLYYKQNVDELSQWVGSVTLENGKVYSFNLNTTTGALYEMSYTKPFNSVTKEALTSGGVTASIGTSYQIYEALEEMLEKVKQLVGTHELLKGKITRCSYDVSVTDMETSETKHFFEIISDQGERIQVLVDGTVDTLLRYTTHQYYIDKQALAAEQEITYKRGNCTISYSKEEPMVAEGDLSRDEAFDKASVYWKQLYDFELNNQKVQITYQAADAESKMPSMYDIVLRATDLCKYECMIDGQTGKLIMMVKDGDETLTEKAVKIDETLIKVLEANEVPKDATEVAEEIKKLQSKKKIFEGAIKDCVYQTACMGTSGLIYYYEVTLTSGSKISVHVDVNHHQVIGIDNVDYWNTFE